MVKSIIIMLSFKSKKKNSFFLNKLEETL